VTACVRSAERFRACGVSPDALARVRVVEGDAADAGFLRRAMEGHQAAVQAAGYIGGTYELGKPLQRLVGCALRAADECLEEPRRLWVLAGAGAACAIPWGPAPRPLLLIEHASALDAAHPGPRLFKFIQITQSHPLPSMPQAPWTSPDGLGR
jgi:hypothetical protein